MKTILFILFFSISANALTKAEKATWISDQLGDIQIRSAVITYLFRKSINNADTPEPYLDDIITVIGTSTSGTVTPPN